MVSNVKVRLGNIEIDMDEVAKKSPIERIELENLLAEAAALKQTNPLQFYDPAQPLCQEFHEAHVDLRVLQGGNRSAKTTTAIVDDIVQATPEELLPPELRAWKRWSCPFYCRIMTPDLQRTMYPVIHKKIAEWMPKALLRGGSFEKAYDKQAYCLRLECGCRFDFLSYEMALDKFGGTDLHRCHYDEEPPEDIREECVVRLWDYGGDELFSFTPLKGLSHTYRNIIKNKDDPRVFVARLDSRKNKYLNQQAIDRAMAGGALGLSDVGIARRVLGEFTEEHGFVYPDVREWTTPRPHPKSIQGAEEILIGIDPGYRICGLTFTASMRSEIFVTFDAVELREKRAVADYAEAMGAVLKKWGLDPAVNDVAFIIDPNNARAKNLVTGESVEDALIREGVITEPGQKDIETGTKIINQLGAKGKLLISDELETLLDVMAEYPLVKDAAGQYVPEKTGREHLADALRYSLSNRAWPDEDEPADPNLLYPVYNNVAAPPPKPQPVEW